MFGICGLDLFQEVVHLFYAILFTSSGSGESESLVIIICIIVNDRLFEDVFSTKFSSVLLYMTGVGLLNLRCPFKVLK